MINLSTPQPTSVVENGKWFPWIRGEGNLFFLLFPLRLQSIYCIFVRRKEGRRKDYEPCNLVSIVICQNKRMFFFKKSNFNTTHCTTFRVIHLPFMSSDWSRFCTSSASSLMNDTVSLSYNRTATGYCNEVIWSIIFSHFSIYIGDRKWLTEVKYRSIKTSQGWTSLFMLVLGREDLSLDEMHWMTW